MAKKQRVDQKIAGRQRLAPSRHNIAKQSAAVLALGLGLAAVGPAEASIVYTYVNNTITNATLDFLNYGTAVEFTAYHGTPTYTLAQVAYNPYSIPISTGAVAISAGGATKLSFGNTIDSSRTWYAGGGILAYGGSPAGYWLGTSGYLGLRFDDVTSGVHYGWAQLSVPEDLSSLTLIDYAYETVRNTQILAGAGTPVPLPGSLALLATGCAGLLAYRRMKRAA